MAKPNPKDVWLEEFEALVTQVNQWFREATKIYAVPSDSGCRAVAVYVMALRNREVDKRDDGREKAIEYGKLFLHHIEPQRRQLERWISSYSRSQPVLYWLEHDKDMLFRIDEIRKHMEVLLPELSPKLDGIPDPIRKLGQVAQAAWAETNKGRMPSAKNTDGPLCKFVQKALVAIGKHYSLAGIGDVLAGRRRLDRGGRFA
jgi:hypothetical protein